MRNFALSECASRTHLSKQTNPLKLNKADKSELIKLDAEFGDVICTYRKDRNWKDVLNLEEEYEKFINARSRGIKYYPQLKMHPNKFSENGLLQRMEELRNKFMNFSCFLSKYYIEILNDYIIKVKYTMKKIFFLAVIILPKTNSRSCYLAYLQNYTDHLSDLSTSNRSVQKWTKQKSV